MRDNDLHIGNIIGTCLGVSIASTWNLPPLITVPVSIVGVIGVGYIVWRLSR